MTAPGAYGDQAHLTWGSLRWSIARGMDMLISTGGPSAQYRGLLAGVDVVLTREQIQGFVTEGDRARLGLPDVTAHANWTLSGDSTLTPA